MRGEGLIKGRSTVGNNVRRRFNQGEGYSREE